MTEKLYVVFTNIPNGPEEEAVFVELENDAGASVGGAFHSVSWEKRPDGYATLGPVVPAEEHQKLDELVTSILEYCETIVGGLPDFLTEFVSDEDKARALAEVVSSPLNGIKTMIEEKR